MEKRLLLLGLLRSHEMHGYQLNEILKNELGLPIKLKKSNAYKLLTDMENEGLIIHHEKQEGNRPVRRVYSITKKGEEAFLNFLRKNIATCPSPQFPSVVGLDFMFALSSDEVVSLLQERLELLDKKFQALDALSEDIRQSHLSIEYHHNYYKNEIQWLTKIIDRYQS